MHGMMSSFKSLHSILDCKNTNKMLNKDAGCVYIITYRNIEFQNLNICIFHYEKRKMEFSLDVFVSP